MTVSRTFRIPKDINLRLNAHCINEERNYTWVLTKALEAYLPNGNTQPSAAVVIQPAREKIIPAVKNDACRTLEYLTMKMKERDRSLRGYSITKGNQKEINARIKEGFSIEDFMRVIDVKINEWFGTDNQKWLRPSTLFNGRTFEGYLNQTDRPQATKGEELQAGFLSDSGNILEGELSYERIGQG